MGPRLLLLLLACTSASGAEPLHLRVPLGFDVFYDLPKGAGGGVTASKRSIVETKLIPGRDGKETLYLRAVAIGQTTLRSRATEGTALEVQVVAASDGEFADFVTQELGAGRVIEPLPLVVGEAPSVIHDDEIGAVIASDEMRLRVKKKKGKDGRTQVSVVALAPGWAALTIFDNKSQMARRYAFHLRTSETQKTKATTLNSPSALAPTVTQDTGPTPNSVPTLTPTTPAAAAEDPPPLMNLFIPLYVGVVIPFASTIPSIFAEPKNAVEYRRLLLPAGRQALYVIGREIGPATLKITDGKGAVRHELQIRVVSPDVANLSKRCEDERRSGGPCEAIGLIVGDLKILDFGAPIGTVVSSDRDLLRYARRNGSEGARELTLQALEAGIADLNLFDDQGILKRRMIFRIETKTGGFPLATPTPVPALPVPK